MEALLKRLNQGAGQEPLLYGYLGLVLLCLCLAIGLYHPAPLVVPMAIVAIGFVVSDLRTSLYLCAGLIAMSTELSLGPIGLDFPVEPLMIVLAALTLVYVIANGKRLDAGMLTHPLSLLLGLHLSWIFITALAATDTVISLKFLAAKLWYVLPFYVLAGYLIRKEFDLLTLIKYIAAPLTFVLCYCIVRHAMLDFSFEFVNKAMSPFFRNHVTYAAISTILLPFFVYAALQLPRSTFWRKLMWVTSALCFFAIYTSYTRAAFVSLLLGIAFIWVIKWKLTRLSLIVATVVIVAASAFLVTQNRFFGFAPNYNKTITHTDFSNLLEATYKLEDISTMERVYRWVAGGYMVGEKPWLGWGPGNFSRQYKGYALESFRTYVSDNPEKSGIHNYLLMTLVEQGYPGLLIFFALCAYGLVIAERAYHRGTTQAERSAALVLAVSLVINLSFQLINDILESDKSGPWFFLCLVLLVNLDRRTANSQSWATARIFDEEPPALHPGREFENDAGPTQQ